MSNTQQSIMVVEDESLLLEAITKKLKILGIEVIPCTSGSQAIEYLKNLQKLPNAVWLDYYLKDMDGIIFMDSLKKEPEWAKIPVFVVSNSASPEKVHNMLALGAKKYLLKAEYRLDEIVDIIKSFITTEASNESGKAPVQKFVHTENT